jgi:hypothetical protein
MRDAIISDARTYVSFLDAQSQTDKRKNGRGGMLHERSADAASHSLRCYL